MSFCVYGDKTHNLADFGLVLACAVCKRVILTTEGRKDPVEFSLRRHPDAKQMDPVTFFIIIDFYIFGYMKFVLLLITMCFALANAQFYYDKHGESRGAYKDSLEYSKLVELAKRFRGPILLKKPVESVKPRKNLEKIPENNIQRTFYVSRDTLSEENWLEVEKNKIVKICVDEPVVAWETSLKAIISSDSCLVFQMLSFIGVETLWVHFYKKYMPYYINFYNDSYSYDINPTIKFYLISRE